MCAQFSGLLCVTYGELLASLRTTSFTATATGNRLTWGRQTFQHLSLDASDAFDSQPAIVYVWV